MNFPFTIQLNQQRTFLFDPIKNLQIKENIIRQNKIDGPSTEDTVSALYHALNVMKAYHNKYLDLKKEANELATQLEPLEKVSQSNRIHYICFIYEILSIILYGIFYSTRSRMN
jgi:hypothetical protein